MENEVLVTWNNSQGAMSYRAVAEHDGGSPLFCESHDPSCMLSGLLCGTLYTVHVIAVGEACSSLPSESVDLHSGDSPELSNPLQLSWSYKDLFQIIIIFMMSSDDTRDHPNSITIHLGSTTHRAGNTLGGVTTFHKAHTHILWTY